MLWFFILPGVALLVWVGVRFFDSALHPGHLDAFARTKEIRTARSSGARWQAAYELSQEFQRLLMSGELTTMPANKKTELFDSLASLLHDFKEDTRLKRYLLLTLSKLGDARAITPLEQELGNSDAELRFFALWGLSELLLKYPSEASNTRLEKIAALAKDEDTATRKVVVTFLLQEKSGAYVKVAEQALQDADTEVRWNAAVALASRQQRSGLPVLREIFDINKLRAQNFHNGRDLSALLNAAWTAAQKLGDKEVLAAAQALKAQASASTPEGRAILAAFK